MQEVIQINVAQSVTIKKETVGAILLDFLTKKTDDSLAPISDLNKIYVELGVYRNGASKPKYVFNDYLDNVLSAMTAGTTRYEIATTAFNTGYLIALGLGGALNLQGNDYAVFKIRIQNTAFTALDVSKSNCTVETVSATKMQPFLNVIDSVSYQTGEDKINKELGNNLVKVVMCNDFTANYTASAKAKPTNGIVITGNGYNKDASENLLYTESIHYTQANPSTALKHLILYNNESHLLHNGKLSCKLDQGVDASARIMVVRREIV